MGDDSAAGTIAYTLTVTDSNGVPAAATATLTVTPAPTATLTAGPSAIVSGQSSTLTWSSTHATTVQINPGIGAVSASGSRSVSPTSTTTYTLTVTDSNGAQVTATATVSVTDGPSATLTALPVEIDNGALCVLTWTTTNAHSAEIDQGIGAVAPVAGGSVQASPTTTTTYTLTVTGTNGATITAAATVSVRDAAPKVTLTASQTVIDSGDSSTLSWTSVNAVSARIDPDVGPVGPVAGGSTAVSPDADTAYTITVTAADGRTASAEATVWVRDPEGPPAVRARTLKLEFGLRQDDAPASQTAVLYAENGEASFLLLPGTSWIASVQPASGVLAEDAEMTIEVTVDPAGLRVGRHAGRLFVRSGGALTGRIAVLLEVLDAAGPAVAEFGVVNAATMTAFGARQGPLGAPALPVAPGSMVAVLGENLLGETPAACAAPQAESFPLPLSLCAVRVLFDERQAPLFAVGPQRIYAQLPAAVGLEAIEADGVAPAAVVVQMIDTSSYPRRFSAAAHAPGIFTMTGAGTGQGAVALAGTTVLAAAPGFSADIGLAQPADGVGIYTASRPVQAGDIVEIYATGLGPTAPPAADGENACGPQGVCLADGSNLILRRTVEQPQVWIGGVEVAEEDVLFSGLAPTLAAVNLVVAAVPPGVEPSVAAEVLIARISHQGVAKSR